MRLSVLDVMPTGAGLTPTDALQQAAHLARHVDRLGFHRLWFAEHHGMSTIASAVPELLIAHVAPLTKHVRVGAGGVMLPNHSPLRVVEQYRTLNALHPGRVDLGLGRAAGTDPLTSHALARQPQAPFEQLLGELLAFAEGRFPDGHPYAQIRVTPSDVALPPLWMLGSSGGSAGFAAQLGTGYAFASHFSPVDPAPAVDAYRRHFTPSAHFPEPQVMLAVSAVIAEDAADARAHCVILAHALQEMLTGVPADVPSLEEARTSSWSEGELRQRLGPLGPQMVYGTAEQVRTWLDAMAHAVDADELMVMTVVQDPEARLASYDLLADSYRLAAPAVA